MRPNGTKLGRTGKQFKPFVISKFRNAFQIKRNLLDTLTLNSVLQACVSSWKMKYQACDILSELNLVLF